MNIAIDADKSLIGGIMAKGYIIVDIPERCYNCALSDPYVTRCMYTKKKGMEKKKITKPFSKPDWCPIRNLNDDLISRDEALFRIRLLRSLYIGRDNQIILDDFELQTRLCGREWNDEVKNELIKKVKNGSLNDRSQLDGKEDGE